ncbi:hypothetical protein D1007_10017 [Hordeum vulgare]|nr:hypothetical protein D1007_10017 [Hordeum vulgare]
MVFDKVDIWFRVNDLPPARRTETFGNALANWLGEIVRVDCDKEGIARGAHLRVRAKISVHEPMVRGFYLKNSQEDKIGTWYDFLYEKVPHFCFECGRLVHVDGICEPPVDSVSQWGGWLRASPGKNKLGKEYVGGPTASKSNSLGTGRTCDREDGWFDQYSSRREAPTKRNLHAEFMRSTDSRTGVGLRSDRGEANSPTRAGRTYEERGEVDLRHGLEERREHDLRDKLMGQRQHGQESWERDHSSKGKDSLHEPCTKYDKQNMRLDGRQGCGQKVAAVRRQGTYVKKPRKEHHAHTPGRSQTSFVNESRKRGPEQEKTKVPLIICKYTYVSDYPYGAGKNELQE